MDPKYNYEYPCKRGAEGDLTTDREKVALEWKQRAAESERRCYTTGSEDRGRGHEPRNSAIDVSKKAKK